MFNATQWVFSGTLFLSAFLMFLLEPMVAKMLLPSLGGSQMVWNTCVVFFQAALLLGYAFADTIRVLGVRRHAFVYLGLQLLACAALPFGRTGSLAVSQAVHPIIGLALALAVGIGLPFFVLSASASSFQRWFASAGGAPQKDPYFLYAASNLGSLLALLLYPVAVEPWLTLHAQSSLWASGYVLFVALTWVCAFGLRRAHAPVSDQMSASTLDRSPSPTPMMRIRWVTLSFVPSSLMLAVTTYLSTDIGTVPLLWIVPLALYLLTFVVAFGSPVGTLNGAALRSLRLLVPVLVLFIAAGRTVPIWMALPLHLFAFASAAMMCHGSLAALRPDASSLTGFYLHVALGGMLGGLFNTVLAPALFSWVVEYPLVLLGACAVPVLTARGASSGRDYVLDALVPLGVGALAALLVYAVRPFDVGPGVLVAVLGIPTVIFFSQSRRPLRFALSGTALLVAGSLTAHGEPLLHAERTFYGMYRVTRDQAGTYRSLIHGTTLHGIQAASLSSEPLTYFHPTGPFGQMYNGLPRVSGAAEVAVVGLGIGSLAGYVRDGQRWTFYELDPAVARIAGSGGFFSHLAKCGEQCQVVVGDGRLSLARARPHQYGLIVLDAFSSDAVPVHLMTREAVLMYLDRLAPGGVLVFNVSNRHLTLGPVLARVASSLGLTAIEQMHWVDKEAFAAGQRSSNWVVMARAPAELRELLADSRWRAPPIVESTPLWTDDFSNILSLLKIR